MQDERAKAALEAQAALEKAKLIAEEQERMANDILDVVDHMTALEAAAKSYMTSGDLYAARQLDSAASRNISTVEGVKRDADQKLKQLLDEENEETSISSVLESTFLDSFPFF